MGLRLALVDRWLFVSVVALAACGGGVTVEDPQASSGQSGAGGGSTGPGGGSTTAGGPGSGPSSASATGSGGGGAGGTDCHRIQHLGPCLAASALCVPVYDDECCPACDPTGACADCIDLTFNRCEPAEEWCAGTGNPGCGFVPDWACNGGSAECPENPGGSPTPCHTVAGCELTTVSSGGPMCDPGPCPVGCAPITAESCTATCNTVPPPCEPGTTALAEGSCWTGWCIPLEVCGDASL